MSFGPQILREYKISTNLCGGISSVEECFQVLLHLEGAEAQLVGEPWTGRGQNLVTEPDERWLRLAAGEQLGDLPDWRAQGHARSRQQPTHVQSHAYQKGEYLLDKQKICCWVIHRR